MKVKLNPLRFLGKYSSRGAVFFILTAALVFAGGCSFFQPWKKLSGDALLPYVQKEGKVLYTYGMADEWASYKFLFDRLKKKHGITRVDIDMSSKYVVQRLAQEKDDMPVDTGVVGITYAAAAKESGALQCYKSPEAAHLPKWAVDPDPHGCPRWYATYYGTLSFMVNKDVLNDVPQSWEDLLKPAYKKMIAYMDPRKSGTGFVTVVSAAYAMGGSIENVQPGIDFFKKLQESGNVQTVATSQNFSDFVSGQTPIIISYDYNLLFQREQLHVNADVVIPSDGSVRFPYVNLITKNPPHPALQRFFIDFILSKEGQEQMMMGFVLPVRDDVKIPEEVKSKFPPKEAYAPVKDVDWSHAKEAQEKIEKAWDEIVPK